MKVPDCDITVSLPTAERHLSSQDPILARVIMAQSNRWPCYATEDPIWGLLRIIMAQQISTSVALRIERTVRITYPWLPTLSPTGKPSIKDLRAIGLPERRAECCMTILRKSDEIRAKVREGQTWGEAVKDIKGIGPWTLSVFRIMVLREPDQLPIGDVGLERAIASLYGNVREIERLGAIWRPFRSVACWYLWRTLGNEQLG
jgi:DNA-3-methyladenine glycosylase II